MILAGDIGGTHTRLALFEVSDGLNYRAEKKYLSRNYSGLAEIIQDFLGKEKVSKACFGIAGPVREGRCHATNLPWEVDSGGLSRQLNIPLVKLLNDLEANAYGVRMLKKDELYVLHAGEPNQKGNAAIISAGTGLGEAGLYWDGKEHHPFACEGGHTDFAPRNELEIELFLYLKKKYEHISYERLVSGMGIREIYSFLTETGHQKVSSQVQDEMKHRDPSIVISEHAKKNIDPACVQTIDWFISLYGSEAGNLALKMLATGGIYIGGGIAPHLVEKMKGGSFVSSFVNKGRFKGMLSSIPIWIILNEQTALLGAGVYAMRFEAITKLPGSRKRPF